MTNRNKEFADGKRAGWVDSLLCPTEILPTMLKHSFDYDEGYREGFYQLKGDQNGI